MFIFMLNKTQFNPDEFGERAFRMDTNNKVTVMSQVYVYSYSLRSMTFPSELLDSKINKLQTGQIIYRVADHNSYK